MFACIPSLVFRLLCEIGGPLVAVVLAALLASIAYFTAHVFTKVLWGPWLLEGLWGLLGFLAFWL